MPDPEDDPRDGTIRRLRAELQRAREDIEDLQRRRDDAFEEIRQLRLKVVGSVNQAAAARRRPFRSSERAMNISTSGT